MAEEHFKEIIDTLEKGMNYTFSKEELDFMREIHLSGFISGRLEATKEIKDEMVAFYSERG
ncbi:hypothetical protein IFU39_16405 [Paenibacillus sp. CFBP 13594]|nr:hypothetical protein [Paenibacillus sp. CFBP 13594]MBD8839395.1 hypothetical protein [Paenibacillus sp. CFBP 13594]